MSAPASLPRDQPGPRAITALGRHRAPSRIWSSDPGSRGWLTAADNNDLGRMFLATAGAVFATGGLLAVLIRARLATPRSAFMGPDVYAQVFTMHGTVMMLPFAIPFLEGPTTFLLPKMLGTRDLAFPRLSACGHWCCLLGGSLLILSLLAGVAPDSGWSMYPPLSSTLGSPGINSGVRLLGITFVEISAVGAAVETVVTALRFRAAGMSLDGLPIHAGGGGDDPDGLPAHDPREPPLRARSRLRHALLLGGGRGRRAPVEHLFWLFGHPEA